MPNAPNQVTSDNLGPAVDIVTWFLAITAFLSVAGRLAAKRILLHFWIDDVFVIIALVLCLGMCATVGLQTKNGLGRHIDTLTDQQLVGFQKASYAGNVLYALILCLTKLSSLFCYQLLTPVPLHRKYIKVLVVLVSVWGLVGFLVTLLQCHAPRLWAVLDADECISRRVFWDYLDVSNIILETILLALPFVVIAGLQADRSKKILILASCFFFRFLVIVALIAQTAVWELIGLYGDVTFNRWSYVICMQLVQTFSIISACVPYLKPLLSSLDSGMIRSDDLRRRSGRPNRLFFGSATQHFDNGASLHRTSRPRAANPASPTPVSEAVTNTLRPSGYGLTRTTVQAERLEDQWDARSQQSNRMIISKAVRWDVQREQESDDKQVKDSDSV